MNLFLLPTVLCGSTSRDATRRFKHEHINHDQ